MPADRTRLPSLGPDPSFTFPAIRKATLASGLRFWTVEHHDVPLVACLLLVPTGAAADPPDGPGLAAMTGDMLDEGCGDRFPGRVRHPRGPVEPERPRRVVVGCEPHQVDQPVGNEKPAEDYPDEHRHRCLLTRP